jgi:hypothetical protein
MSVKSIKILNEKSGEGLWANIRAKRARGEKPAKPGDSDYPNKKGWNKAVKASKNESEMENEAENEMSSRYMFFSNLTQIHRQTGKLLELDENKINDLLDNGHDWAEDHLATCKESLEQVFDFMMNEFKGSGESESPISKGFTNENFFALVDEIIKEQTGTGVIDDLNVSNNRLCEGKITAEKLNEMVNEAISEYYDLTEENINEAEYKGRKVSLGKISRGDVKKYKVHVKNGKGNVVKVEFGDPNMEIKRDNPKRKKSFRARHHCENPGPRWKARYWSCRNWSNKPVSKMVGENKKK